MTDIDWSSCTIVESYPDKLGGVPTVRDWRVSADTVVENFEDGVTPEEIAEMFSLPIHDVKDILAYAEQVRSVAHPV